MSKPKILPNIFNAKVSSHNGNTGFSIVGRGWGGGWGLWEG